MSRKRRLVRWSCLALAQALVLAGVAGSAQADPLPSAGGGVAKGTFDVVSFTIEPYQVLPNGVTLNDFRADDVFHGDLSGTGTARAQMLSRPDGSANEAGLIHVEGELAGRTGSFVIQTVGEASGNTASAVWTILPGSGTGELTGLRGQGGETAVNDGSGWVATYRLTYYFS